MIRGSVRCLFAGLVPVIVAGGACSSSPTHWTEVVNEERLIDSASLKAVAVRTHDGTIAFNGRDDVSGDTVVSVRKRGGGSSPSDAEAALDAIDVYIEPAGSGLQKIGWRWKGVKRRGWGARVDFEIAAPGGIRLDAETHNGAVRARGLTADASLTTHNGAIDVASSGRSLNVITHNGRIVAQYSGESVSLTTHNGSITTDLSGARAPSGVITTHNGAIRVDLGEASSTRLICQTHRGTISCDLPLRDSRVSQSRLIGTVGDGTGTLNMTTHNGSIRLAKGSG